MSFSFLFPYISVSLAINILICILTVLRLLYHRACISKALGPAYGFLYASFAAMIVESAAVYSICSLLYLVPYAINSPLADAFMQILGEAQVTCSLPHSSVVLAADHPLQICRSLHPFSSSTVFPRVKPGDKIWLHAVRPPVPRPCVGCLLTRSPSEQNHRDYPSTAVSP